MSRATMPVAVPYLPQPSARTAPAAVVAEPAREPAVAGGWDAPFRVVEVADTAAFTALRQEWTETLEASVADGLFLTWEWHATWWRHLAGDARLTVLAVRRGERLVALAPFVLQRARSERPFGAFGAARLEPLGNGPVGSDYLDVVARAGEEIRALRTLAGELDARRRVLELPQLQRAGSGAEMLAGSLVGRGWRALERVTHLCPYADLRDRTWEEYLQELGPRHRENVRRRIRKLEAAHEVSFTRVERVEELPEAFETMMRLHHLRWGPRGGSDGLHTPGLVAFHRDFARLALERGWLRLYTLRLDGVPAAAVYGFRYRDRFLYYQGGFDPARAHLAVGLVSMAFALRAAIEEGAREFDFLHGDEPYKFLWARGSRELVRLELYPPSAAGRLEHALRHTVRSIKGGIRRWLGGRRAR